MQKLSWILWTLMDLKQMKVWNCHNLQLLKRLDFLSNGSILLVFLDFAMFFRNILTRSRSRCTWENCFIQKITKTASISVYIFLAYLERAINSAVEAFQLYDISPNDGKLSYEELLPVSKIGRPLFFYFINPT